MPSATHAHKATYNIECAHKETCSLARHTRAEDHMPKDACPSVHTNMCIHMPYYSHNQACDLAHLGTLMRYVRMTWGVRATWVMHATRHTCDLGV